MADEQSMSRLTIVAIPATVAVRLAASGEGRDMLAFGLLPVGRLVSGTTEAVLPRAEVNTIQYFSVDCYRDLA